MRLRLLALAACLAGSPPASTFAAPADAAYHQAIEKRTDGILAALVLPDAAVRQRVHDAILAQYEALNDWQAAHEADLHRLEKQKRDAATEAGIAQITAARQVLHDRFLARLAADLTPAQIDTVKDRMTYNKVKVTYDAYCEIIPGLTAAQKDKVLALLREAREEAMDGVSAAEKSAIFKRYKGKINIYLSAQGIDVAKDYKDWGRRQKATAP